MHKLNNGIHACVFPTRCGTRWIAQTLFDNNLIDYTAPNHEFDINQYDKNLQNIMFVRNPFTRERSIYRWYKVIKEKEYKDITFEEFVNSDDFEYEPTYVQKYQDKIKLIDKFVHLEMLDNFMKRAFNINKIYIGDYHIPGDDSNDRDAYNDQLIEKVLIKYKEDLKLIDFDLTSYI